jgi:hypothetical protein
MRVVVVWSVFLSTTLPLTPPINSKLCLVHEKQLGMIHFLHQTSAEALAVIT